MLSKSRKNKILTHNTARDHKHNLCPGMAC